ncbi:MAG: hypothetical protein KC457_28850, partial [Myxococcales bacterium]|nr:hypothetical protein [Myxococcales bacterium]
LLAFQHSELGVRHPLRHLQLRLRSHPRCLPLDLGPLAVDDYDALLIQLLGGGQLKPELAADLHRQSGGCPLHARELVRAAVDAGVLIQRDGTWSLDSTEWPIPRGLRSRLAERLRSLPKALVAVLRTGSILAVGTGEFDLEDVVELHTETRDAIVMLLDDAVHLRMLDRHREHGRRRLRFLSEVLRRIIHDDIPERTRMRLHEHCARHIARQYRATGNSHEIAQLTHLIAAKSVVAARPMVLTLVQRALDDSRPKPAAGILAAMLEVADSLPVYERGELRLLSAELELMRKEPQAAVSALQRLATILGESHDPRLERLGERGAELARTLDRRQLADRLLGLRPLDRRSAERQRRARAELASLRPATNSRSMAIGDLRLMHGEYTESREAYDVARLRAARELDREEEARQLQKLARVSSKLGHHDAAIAYCREGLSLLEGGASLERIGLWAHAANIHCATGHLDRAQAELETAGIELAKLPSRRGHDRDRVAAEFERANGNLLMARGHAEQAIAAGTMTAATLAEAAGGASYDDPQWQVAEHDDYIRVTATCTACGRRWSVERQDGYHFPRFSWTALD